MCRAVSAELFFNKCARPTSSHLPRSPSSSFCSNAHATPCLSTCCSTALPRFLSLTSCCSWPKRFATLVSDSRRESPAAPQSAKLQVRISSSIAPCSTAAFFVGKCTDQSRFSSCGSCTLGRASSMRASKLENVRAAGSPPNSADFTTCSSQLGGCSVLSRLSASASSASSSSSSASSSSSSSSPCSPSSRKIACNRLRDASSASCTASAAATPSSSSSSRSASAANSSRELLMMTSDEPSASKRAARTRPAGSFWTALDRLGRSSWTAFWIRMRFCCKSSAESTPCSS
mmetsp:Transcript_30812/g.73102  ORF Transcript_30812/g.73102 Transcript_30812/m.73102 type:complete len:289 (-) Transcript_30812:706-1572(-)